MKLSAAFEASIALSFGDVSDAYQFFPSTLGISDNPDYRANLQHCRITDIDYKRNHAGVSDHVPLLPVGRHYIGKDETVAIERVNSRLRHWFARFRPVWCRKRSRWSTPPSHCLPPTTLIEQRQNSPCHWLLNTLSKEAYELFADLAEEDGSAMEVRDGVLGVKDTAVGDVFENRGKKMQFLFDYEDAVPVRLWRRS